MEALDLNTMMNFICENADDLEFKDACEFVRLVRDSGAKLREKTDGIQIMLDDVAPNIIPTLYNFVKQVTA